MLKGRNYEIQLLEQLNNQFSEKIIPLIEIVNEHFRQTEFARDPVTGEFLKCQKGKRLQRYRIPPTENDIDTLHFYNNLLNNKKGFIDFFRFSTDVYGRKLDISSVELSQRMNQNEKLYIDHLLEVCQFDNLIPVLSLKKGFFLRQYQLSSLIEELQKNNHQIAIRLDDDAFEAYCNEVSESLRENDFLLFDIGEQNPASKAIELREFNNIVSRAHKGVVNSPRKRSVQNGHYENRKYTDLIDNSLKDVLQKDYKIAAYGDYCGLKDNLPVSSKGQFGAALALFYHFANNKFFAYVNENTQEALAGYKKIIPQMIEDTDFLDPKKTCPAMREVESQYIKMTSGNWGTWNKITVIRYINQINDNC